MPARFGVLLSYSSFSAIFFLQNLGTWSDRQRNSQSRSQLVQQNGELPNIEEDVVLRSIRYIAGEVFSNNAVPVGRVFFVEKGFDKLSDIFFGVFAVNSLVNLVLDVGFHFWGHFADFPLHNSFCHLLG